MGLLFRTHHKSSPCQLEAERCWKADPTPTQSDTTIPKKKKKCRVRSICLFLCPRERSSWLPSPTPECRLSLRPFSPLRRVSSIGSYCSCLNTSGSSRSGKTIGHPSFHRQSLVGWSSPFQLPLAVYASPLVWLWANIPRLVWLNFTVASARDPPTTVCLFACVVVG